MRCSGSRAGNGCEPRMRRTWWPRPTAGLRGAGGAGSQGASVSEVELMLGRQNSHPAALTAQLLWSERYHCRARVVWPSPGEARVEIRKPTKTTAANPNRQSPIANCPMAKRRPIRRCGVAEPSWRCRQSAARRRMRRRDNRYCLVGAGCWDGRHDETGKPE